MKTRLFLLAAACLGATPSVWAQSPLYLASLDRTQPLLSVQPAKRIHVILAGDTNDAKIGRSVDVDLQNLAGVFRQLIPAEWQLQMRTLRGNDVSKGSILRTINSCQPGPDDAIVFIWTGHGAHNTVGHYFCLPGGDGLYRADVVAAMRLRSPRLVVLLSGSCNEESNAALQREYRRHYCLYPNVHEDAQTIAPIAEELFLKPRGVVDINGASEGELTFGNSERGCSFLHPLLDYLRCNSGRRISWPTLVSEVGPLVQSLFDVVHPKGYIHEASQKLYTKQTLKVWALPEDSEGPRFGVGAVDNNGDGVRLVAIWANYPATRAVVLGSGQRCVLEPNDVILAINGQSVRCVHDFELAVKTSPQQMVLAVRNWRDGQVGVLAVTLRY